LREHYVCENLCDTLTRAKPLQGRRRDIPSAVSRLASAVRPLSPTLFSHRPGGAGRRRRRRRRRTSPYGQLRPALSGNDGLSCIPAGPVIKLCAGEGGEMEDVLWDTMSCELSGRVSPPRATVRDLSFITAGPRTYTPWFRQPIA
jgi:hypothetical protein